MSWIGIFEPSSRRAWWDYHDNGLVRAPVVVGGIYKIFIPVMLTLVCDSCLGWVWAMSRHFGDIESSACYVVTSFELELSHAAYWGLYDWLTRFQGFLFESGVIIVCVHSGIKFVSMQPHFIVTSNGVFWFQIKLFATVANKMNIANWVFSC